MVAAATGNEGLASSPCHEAKPGGLLRPAGLVEISEPADVMNLDVCCGSAELAPFGEQTLNQLAVSGADLYRWVVGEDCMWLSFERDASEALDGGLDALAWSVRSLDSGGMFAGNLHDRGLVLGGQCLQQ